jgi:predicted NBD/HSP70 family sugar kinase
MPGVTTLTVANEILLRGPVSPEGRLHRATLLDGLGIGDGAFRRAGHKLGAHQGEPGLRFFDSSVEGYLAFGPGAGLAIGVSVGTESLRACLVDANGWRYCEHGRYDVERLRLSPREIVGQIHDAVNAVIKQALEGQDLTVDGSLPILGIGVAWPTPVNRHAMAMGHALAHADWRGGAPLDSLVRSRIAPSVPPSQFDSYAMNDAQAAALAVAHRQTRSTEGDGWPDPRLALVVRVAGGVGSGIVIVEKPRRRRERNKNDPIGERLESGFVNTILVAGADNHAGEIGHAPIRRSFVDELNRRRKPRGLRALAAVPCSCGADPEETHVEAFACARSLAARFGNDPMYASLRKITEDEENPAHARALSDVGRLLGEALVAPVAVLNPATITLTGSLAVETVEHEIAARLTSAHPFGEDIVVTALNGHDNDYVRATGAALAIIRNRVHRRLEELVGRKGRVQPVEALGVRVARPF